MRVVSCDSAQAVAVPGRQARHATCLNRQPTFMLILNSWIRHAGATTGAVRKDVARMKPFSHTAPLSRLNGQITLRTARARACALPAATTLHALSNARRAIVRDSSKQRRHNAASINILRTKKKSNRIGLRITCRAARLAAASWWYPTNRLACQQRAVRIR